MHDLEVIIIMLNSVTVTKSRFKAAHTYQQFPCSWRLLLSRPIALAMINVEIPSPFYAVNDSKFTKSFCTKQQS
jgi:hypothetical protein